MPLNAPEYVSSINVHVPREEKRFPNLAARYVKDDMCSSTPKNIDIINGVPVERARKKSLDIGQSEAQPLCAPPADIV